MYEFGTRGGGAHPDHGTPQLRPQTGEQVANMHSFSSRAHRARSGPTWGPRALTQP